MDINPVTRVQLESLTTSDLLKMADTMGIDIPPELDRIFIIEELLEIASQDEAGENLSDASNALGKKAADISVSVSAALDTDDSVPSGEAPGKEPPDTRIIESVLLPKQYNITYIEVMIRDPLWAFVFWEIKIQDKEQIERSQDFEGYYLKVTSWGTPEQFFTVPLKPDDTARYLGFTLDTEARISPASQIQYKVELCASMKGNEMILASSNPFCLPGLYEFPSGAGKQEAGPYINPLVRLSGYGDFHILRYSERQVRAKRGALA